LVWEIVVAIIHSLLGYIKQISQVISIGYSYGKGVEYFIDVLLPIDDHPFSRI